MYRRFPERSDLVDALFEEGIALVGARLEEALAVPDPWTGLCDLVLWSVHRMANDRGPTQVLTAAGHALTSRIGAPGNPGARERHATLLRDGLSAHRDSPTPMPAPAPTAQDLACIAAPDDRPGQPSR
ncbi:TetR/AcrR family transcriptional regulator [Geodermatophilus sp. URMC 62]|uniref:TetR/AcrR family transcriptional regulator n=1 Tax=Geodermatophilus sp. URMC 62 TaxID=3423414 RepID=UPI00406BE46D